MARTRRGTEPRTARSPLRLRSWIAFSALLLAVVGLAVTVPMAMDDSSSRQGRATIAVALLVAVAVVAVVNLAVVRHRIRRGDKG